MPPLDLGGGSLEHADQFVLGLVAIDNLRRGLHDSVLDPAVIGPDAGKRLPCNGRDALAHGYGL